MTELISGSLIMALGVFIGAWIAHRRQRGLSPVPFTDIAPTDDDPSSADGEPKDENERETY